MSCKSNASSVVHLCIFVCQYSRSRWLQTRRRFNLGKSTIRCSENDDVSSRSSLMVSLSKSIQQVTNREAVGVLQCQGLANSQYDDNSMLAFSFPEETDSQWQLRRKMFAYFCSNNFSCAFKGQYMLQICSLALLRLSPFTYIAYPRKILINMAFQGICMHEIRPCLSYTNVPFCTIFLSLSFCPSNAFRGVAMQPTSGSS